MKNIVAICVGACVMVLIVLGTIVIAKESIKIREKYDSAGELLRISTQNSNIIENNYENSK